MQSMLPVVTVRHPGFECDDVINTLVLKSSPDDSCVVVSTDSDFTQLYDRYKNVTVWNPVKKQDISPVVGYDYVTWKALRGDKADNIPGIPGVGDKTAQVLASDNMKLTEFLSDPSNRQVFERNVKLISLADVSLTKDDIEVWDPPAAWDDLKSQFNSLGFKSITSLPSWYNFVDTFARVKHGRPSWLNSIPT
jgi:hypothetical protein